MDIVLKYKTYCYNKGVDYERILTVNPYDTTTLFCPAGMQRYKNKFKNESYVDTTANIQSCIRMNDFNEIGDATHLLHFNMMGLFSFRELTIKDAIDFWMQFLEEELKLKIDYVTIHPDKEEWKKYYSIPVRIDNECKWSDGEIGGYCTEFYINDIEIGNIVNPLDTCIDVGFGLERLNMMVNGINNKSKLETLVDAAQSIILSGYKPSNLKQGYILRKILREIYKLDGSIKHNFFEEEKERQKRIFEKYQILKKKHLDKTKEWWYETHGIDINDV